MTIRAPIPDVRLTGETMPKLSMAGPFRRLLLGIDFGSASLAAARWATKYVAPNGDAVLSHVMPTTSPDDESAEADGLHSLRQLLPALTGGLGGFGATLAAATVRAIVRQGRPSRVLSAIANGVEASLVVLGRRSDANRTRIGEPNVIERVARRTSASVLVVPEGISSPPRHIVAAVDASDFAPRVLRIARWLARLHHVPMTVVHVLSPDAGEYDRVIRAAPRAPSGVHRIPPAKRLRLSNAARARSMRWLAQLLRNQEQGLLTRAEIVAGDPAREIAAAASAREAPLIVVGARGADDSPPGSLGSVVRELLTRAPMPVLAVNVG